MTGGAHRRNVELDALDLDAIEARYSLARMAGEAADDAGEGWDNSKIRAMVRSWQDIGPLYRAVVAERKRQEVADRARQ